MFLLYQIQHLDPGEFGCCGNKPYNYSSEFCCNGVLLRRNSGKICCEGIVVTMPPEIKNAACCRKRGYDYEKQVWCNEPLYITGL